jgi:hypothetical protein
MSQEVKMWVDPRFKKEVKKKAAEEGCSIIEYTKRLSENLEVRKDEKKIFTMRF